MVEWAAVIAAGVIAGIVLKLYMRWIVESLGEKIFMKYPVVEVLSAVIFVLVFLKSGFGLQMFMVAAVFSLFLALSVVDYHFHAIPDSMSLGLLTVSFLGIASGGTACGRIYDTASVLCLLLYAERSDGRGGCDHRSGNGRCGRHQTGALFSLYCLFYRYPLCTFCQKCQQADSLRTFSLTGYFSSLFV